MSTSRRKEFLNRTPDKPLSLKRQCSLLSLSRSGLYYVPRGESEFNLSLMREMDETFLKYPFFGSRQMTRFLVNKGHSVGRERVTRLMRIMGLHAIYQEPRTTIVNPENKKYPYLLRGMKIDHANQVWSTDITYISMKKGFLYLTAIIDWYSRKILSWRLSNSMDVGFCIEALQEAMNRYGKPEIFNSDQGSQYTSLSFIGILQNAGVRISMDGRKRCRDNIFIERFWRSLKYEEIYIHNYESGIEARKGIGKWINFYNEYRPHSGLDGTTPDHAYFGSTTKKVPATKIEGADSHGIPLTIFAPDRSKLIFH